MAKYQGHRSWNAWNVSLWIMNEEPLYRFAQQCLRGRSPSQAARKFMREFEGERTPDGGNYNYTCVYEVMKDMRAEGDA